jgi:hypothetical protein
MNRDTAGCGINARQMGSYYPKLLYDKKIYKRDTKYMQNFNTLEIYFIDDDETFFNKYFFITLIQMV